MIFFWTETPDGWGIPSIHGPLSEDELDGYVQSGVYLVRGRGLMGVNEYTQMMIKGFVVIVAVRIGQDRAKRSVIK